MISGIVMSSSEDNTNEVFYYKDVFHFEYREKPSNSGSTMLLRNTHTVTRDRSSKKKKTEF